MTKKNILILVEGQKKDKDLMCNLLKEYKFTDSYDVISYCTNIYVLFNAMFREAADSDIEEKTLDIVQVLRSREKDETQREILNNKFTDIILVFDFDPQDHGYSSEKIKLMQNYFSDSTDTGKLYINYPMVEAFYHMEKIPDPMFFNRQVDFLDLEKHKYKQIVSAATKDTDPKRFTTTHDEMNTVILQNLQKAYFLSGQEKKELKELMTTDSPIPFGLILSQQILQLDKYRIIPVLCTCCLFVWEYNPKLIDSFLEVPIV